MSELPQAARQPEAVRLASEGDAVTVPQSSMASHDAVGMRILAISPDCIKIVNLDGTLRSMNEAGLCLMEIDDFATVEGTLWSQSWPEPARSQIEEAIKEARDGRISRFTEFCPTAKGTPKWWDVVVSSIVDRSGHIEALLVVSRDITVQRQYEDRLRMSEQRFRALADNIAQLAWMADATGHIFWYNQRWFKFTGTTMEDMAENGWRKVHHPQHLERITKKIAEHFVSGDPWEDTFPLRGADGDYRWFLSRAMPIRNERQKIILWCGTNTDITEQRDASLRLRQKARLIALSHEAIIVWDQAAGIVSWNKGCEELYGYDSSEAIGSKTHELLRTRHPMPVEDFEELLRTEGSWTGELLHFSKSGAEVWVDSRQEMINVGGRSLILETNRDITHRRKADEMMQLLLGELDHRVKNTLAIVQSIASQTARRSESLAVFSASFGARLQSLSSAHNLLTASSWSGARMHELIRAQAAEGAGFNRQIRVQGPDVVLPPQVALQLSLIVFELATNARKYGALSCPNGVVDIEWSVGPTDAPRLEMMWRETGGPTVAPAPERRGFGTTLIERAGSQPHLQAALAFLPEGVQCRISADVAMNQSAPAQYFNPRRRSDAPDADPSPAVRREMETVAPKRVLIVEDEPLIALEIEELLVANEFAKGGIAASVSDALQALDKGRPDLAVVDGNLLGESAMPVVERLTALHVPFVMVTGFSPESLPPSIERDRVPILRKPFEGERLLAALRSLAGEELLLL